MNIYFINEYIYTEEGKVTPTKHLNKYMEWSRYIASLHKSREAVQPPSLKHSLSNINHQRPCSLVVVCGLKNAL